MQDQLDLVILGDNQFFGINHRSEEKAIAQSVKFPDAASIIRVIDDMYAAGIHAFSFSTHDRVEAICNHFRANKDRFNDLRLYPVLPYAHKYADLVAEKGVLGALMQVLAKDNTAGEGVRMVSTGIEALISRNPMDAMEILVDAELKMFRELNIRVVFLQNVVTDMLLGLGMGEPLKAFHDHIRKNYDAEAGFMTLNLPAAVDFLIKHGIENPIVCSAINKIGFQMNPDLASYEAALNDKQFRAVAMSPMAAGALSPEAAFEYIASKGKIQSVLYGASSRGNAVQTLQVIERHMANARAPGASAMNPA